VVAFGITTMVTINNRWTVF